LKEHEKFVNKIILKQQDEYINKSIETSNTIKRLSAREMFILAKNRQNKTDLKYQISNIPLEIHKNDLNKSDDNK